MITEKETKRLLDIAIKNAIEHNKAKELIFLDRIKNKIRRNKKLNETEEKRLKENANA